MTAINLRKCETCMYYFENEPDEQKGVCKYDPPVPYPMQTMNALNQPQLTVIMIPATVMRNEWCSHWESLQLELSA